MKIFFKDESGSIITEFTAGISVLCILFLGILDCSRALYIRHFIGAASQSATRFAMVRGSSFAGTSCGTNAYGCAATSGDISTYVQKDLPPGVASNKLQVLTTWPGTVPGGAACNNFSGNNSPGCIVNVSVTYSYSFLFPFLPQDSFAMSSSSSLTIAK